MFKSKMIENEKSLQCGLKHQLPIVQVILNPQICKDQRLLCNECLDNVDIDGKVVGFKKVIQMIEEQQNQKMNFIENMITQNINQIELFQNLIDQMKSNIIQQLEQLNTILKDWITNLQSIAIKHSHYSFHEELDILINKKNNIKLEQTSFIQQMNIEYYNWNSKVNPKLDQYNQFPEYDKCKKILSDLQIEISNNQQFEDLNDNSIIYKIEAKSTYQIKQMQLLQEEDVKLQLVDKSVNQMDYCLSIVFNTSGSIMVTTNEALIKVWNFNNGKIELHQTLEQHNNWVHCLIYSRKQDAFLSGSRDKIIRIWKLNEENKWTSPQFYQQHTDRVYCLVFNQNEDQLFSGSADKSIKVWQLDFSNDKLIYQYSLDKHQNEVMALSLNQSESLLVSCGDGENDIIIWERGNHNKMEFKYIVIINQKLNNQLIKFIQQNQIITINQIKYKQSISCSGAKIQFIKDDQFIWIPNAKLIDQVFIFELNEGIFQENQHKIIQLHQNNSYVDMYQFPIIYNKERNVIIVRHKTYIYIIRELNNGQFKIIQQLNFNRNSIYGTISNNGQYLACWDEQNKFYSIYELLYE